MPSLFTMGFVKKAVISKPFLKIVRPGGHGSEKIF